MAKNNPAYQSPEEFDGIQAKHLTRSTEAPGPGWKKLIEVTPMPMDRSKLPYGAMTWLVAVDHLHIQHSPDTVTAWFKDDLPTVLGLQGLVQEFHQKMGLPVAGKPTELSPERIKLRMDLIKEESRELHEALGNGVIREIAKELADLLYVVYGTAVELGIDIAPAFEDVHVSNMTKTPGNEREDGKVLKGDNYQAPNILVVPVDKRLT